MKGLILLARVENNHEENYYCPSHSHWEGGSECVRAYVCVYPQECAQTTSH